MNGYDTIIQIPLSLNGNNSWISVVAERNVLEQIQKDGSSSDTTQYRLIVESIPVVPTTLQNNFVYEGSFHSATSNKLNKGVHDFKKCILCGKENATSKNPGNLFFKKHMKENRGRYRSCNNDYEKKVFIKKVYHALIENNHRFLLSEGKGWKEMDQKYAIKKIGQALREKRLHSDIDGSPLSAPKTPPLLPPIDWISYLDTNRQHGGVDLTTQKNILKTPPMIKRKLNEAYSQGFITDSDSNITFKDPTEVKKAKTLITEQPNSSPSGPRPLPCFTQHKNSTASDHFPSLNSLLSSSRGSGSFDLSTTSREDATYTQSSATTLSPTPDEHLEDEHREVEHREVEHREVEHREVEHREVEHREVEHREVENIGDEHRDDDDRDNEHRGIKHREDEHREDQFLDL